MRYFCTMINDRDLIIDGDGNKTYSGGYDVTSLVAAAEALELYEELQKCGHIKDAKQSWEEGVDIKVNSAGIRLWGVSEVNERELFLQLLDGTLDRWNHWR